MFISSYTVVLLLIVLCINEAKYLMHFKEVEYLGCNRHWIEKYPVNEGEVNRTLSPYCDCDLQDAYKKIRTLRDAAHYQCDVFFQIHYNGNVYKTGVYANRPQFYDRSDASTVCSYKDVNLSQLKFTDNIMLADVTDIFEGNTSDLYMRVQLMDNSFTIDRLVSEEEFLRVAYMHAGNIVTTSRVPEIQSLGGIVRFTEELIHCD